MDSVIARWVAFDRCPAAVVGETVRGQPGTPAAAHTAAPNTYGPCAEGSEVVLWKLTGAGHVWPGAKEQPWHEYVGPPTDVIDANIVIWQFFRRFALPN